MVLATSVETFTFLHVVISLIGIMTGFVEDCLLHHPLTHPPRGPKGEGA